MASRVAKQGIKGEPKVVTKPAPTKGCGHSYKGGSDKEGEHQKKG